MNFIKLLLIIIGSILLFLIGSAIPSYIIYLGLNGITKVDFIPVFELVAGSIILLSIYKALLKN